MRRINEAPHFDTEESSGFSQEFVESLKSIEDLSNDSGDVIPGSEVYGFVKDTQVLDFAFERYKLIKDLERFHDKVSKQDQFYVDLSGNTFLFDYENLTSKKLEDGEDKDDSLVTLPDKWYYAFLHRIDMLPKSELIDKTVMKESKIRVTFKKKLLDLPDVRQSNDYSCGASSLLSILSYYNKFDGNESKLSRELNTNSKDGTKPENIVKVAKKYGLDALIKNNSSLQDLKMFLANKIPVIINYQAWTDKKNNNWAKNKSDGHYSVLVGLDQDNIYLEDPSLLGSDGYIPVDEFMDRWHDVGYTRMCIPIRGKKVEQSKFKRIK